MSLPAVAVTMGDPAGVGPEICLKALADPRVTEVCSPVLIGNEAVLAAAAKKLGLSLCTSVTSVDESAIEFSPGEVSAACGRAAYEKAWSWSMPCI